MGWLTDPNAVKWWHYALLFIAFAAGYWAMWMLGI